MGPPGTALGGGVLTVEAHLTLRVAPPVAAEGIHVLVAPPVAAELAGLAAAFGAKGTVGPADGGVAAGGAPAACRASAQLGRLSPGVLAPPAEEAGAAVFGAKGTLGAAAAGGGVATAVGDAAAGISLIVAVALDVPLCVGARQHAARGETPRGDLSATCRGPRADSAKGVRSPARAESVRSS